MQRLFDSIQHGDQISIGRRGPIRRGDCRSHERIWKGGLNDTQFRAWGQSNGISHQERHRERPPFGAPPLGQVERSARVRETTPLDSLKRCSIPSKIPCRHIRERHRCAKHATKISCIVSVRCQPQCAGSHMTNRLFVINVGSARHCGPGLTRECDLNGLCHSRVKHIGYPLRRWSSGFPSGEYAASRLSGEWCARPR